MSEQNLSVINEMAECRGCRVEDDFKYINHHDGMCHACYKIRTSHLRPHTAKLIEDLHKNLALNREAHARLKATFNKIFV